MTTITYSNNETPAQMLALLQTMVSHQAADTFSLDVNGIGAITFYDTLGDTMVLHGTFVQDINGVVTSGSITELDVYSGSTLLMAITDIAALDGAKALMHLTEALTGSGSGFHELGGLMYALGIQNSITINGSGGSDVITGTTGDDNLNGGGGNDILIGGNGNDKLSGGTGNDTLTGGSGEDMADYGVTGVTAMNGPQGAASVVTKGVTVNLATGTATDAAGGRDTLSGIEDVRGSAGNDSITGDANTNKLLGGAGKDTISAGGGNDYVDGGAGVDNLTGGAGSDTFIFSAKADIGDSITDFVHGADHIALVSAAFGFTGTGAATQGVNFFAKGATTGMTAKPSLIYDQATGNLWYDADGSGSGAATLLTHVAAHTVITASDVLLM